MKYLFLLTILLGCKSGPRKVVVPHADNDTTGQISVKRDTTSIDIHDPYETGKDTARLNSIMDKIFKFPEVEAINKQINKTSKGTHGISIMVHDEFEGDTSYYNLMIGDNSHEGRYVNVLNFLLEKKIGQIKAYDRLLDSVMSLQDWRKTRK
jgi:hypothetical protein